METKKEDMCLPEGLGIALDRKAELGDSSPLDFSWETKLLVLREWAQELCPMVTMPYFMRALEVACQVEETRTMVSFEWHLLLEFLTRMGFSLAPSQDPRLLNLWAHLEGTLAGTPDHSDRVVLRVQIAALVSDLRRTHQVWLEPRGVSEKALCYYHRIALSAVAAKALSRAPGEKFNIVPYPGHPDLSLLMDDEPPSGPIPVVTQAEVAERKGRTKGKKKKK